MPTCLDPGAGSAQPWGERDGIDITPGASPSGSSRRQQSHRKQGNLKPAKTRP